MKKFTLKRNQERKSAFIAKEAHIGDAYRRKAAAQGREQSIAAYRVATTSLARQIQPQLAAITSSHTNSEAQTERLRAQFRRIERLHRHAQKQLLSAPLLSLSCNNDEVSRWQSQLESIDREVRILELLACTIELPKSRV